VRHGLMQNRAFRFDPKRMELSDRQRIYWNRNRGLTIALLLVWFSVTFCIPFFARSMTFTVMGWPFSFYMAAQGCLVIYLLLILVYANRLRRLDEEYGVAELEDE
jgi:putative solute:sodium symporter small subunit